MWGVFFVWCLIAFLFSFKCLVICLVFALCFVFCVLFCVFDLFGALLFGALSLVCVFFWFGALSLVCVFFLLAWLSFLLGFCSLVVSCCFSRIVLAGICWCFFKPVSVSKRPFHFHRTDSPSVTSPPSARASS